MIALTNFEKHKKYYMIIVTGAAGFIGSCLITKLNSENFNNIIAVDDFSNVLKNKNIEGKNILCRVEIFELFEWIREYADEIEFIYHLGAISDTTAVNPAVLQRYNTDYSKVLWDLSIEYQLPVVYASSAATYGDGNLGFIDNEDKMGELRPLNLYAQSKHDFDLFALESKKKPFFWRGYKFFNVYGPNEFHKGKMSSMILQGYNQIINSGEIKLFKSYNPDYAHGEQSRDFIYIKDVIDILFWTMINRTKNGIINVGSGISNSFNQLANGIFYELNQSPMINYIDMPLGLERKYQYETKANVDKLLNFGYKKSFTTLREGIKDYVRNYLTLNNTL